MILPLSIKTTLSVTASTSESICEDNNTVLPELACSLIKFLNHLIPLGSRPFVGSSKIRYWGFHNSAVAIPNL